MKSQSGIGVLKALPALSGIKHFVSSNNSIIIANVSTSTVTIVRGLGYGFEISLIIGA